MKLAIVDLDTQTLDDAVRSFKDKNIETIGIAVDVADREGMAKAAQTAIDAFGKVHLLVNNAGVGGGGLGDRCGPGA